MYYGFSNKMSICNKNLLNINTIINNHMVILFQVITCGISMFICNTATCAMMCPILKVGVEDEEDGDDEEEGVDGDNESSAP